MAKLIDHDARARALTDFDATLLVEAGAGTGKTSLLAGRIALLLASGVHPRGMVAITFTELAAGELRARVDNFLTRLRDGEVPQSLQPALPEGLSPEQRDRLTAAARQLDELTCTTIHGFCYQLIRPYPIEAQLDPGARVMDANEALLAHTTLAEQWLREELEKDPADAGPLAELILRDPVEGLRQVQDLGLFLREHRTVQAAEGPPVDAPRAAFIKAVDDFSTWAHDTEAATGVVEESTAQSIAEFERLAAFVEDPGAPPGSYGALLRLAEPPRVADMRASAYVLKQYRRKGKWQTAAKDAGLRKAAGDPLNAEATLRYDAIAESLRVFLDAVGASLLAPLVRQFRTLEARYADLKRSAALLDFDDLLHHARDLLAARADVRAALARRYTHILVDEFQDTDPVQSEILFLLCGDDNDGAAWNERPLRPGQLFAVGDPKQAIYRFRGADIATYLRVRDAIETQFPGNCVEVRANFRSTEPILAFANTGFEASLSQPGQPGFAPLAPTVEGSPHPLPGVAALDVPPPAGDTVEDLRRAEAERISEACEGLLGRLRVRRDDGTVGLCRASDIALLAPVGTALWLFEHELERCGIPIAPRAGKGLYRQQEVQDLIALVRVLADPRDTLALGALLRGPLVGLTEQELLDITAALPPNPERPHFDPRLALWTEPGQVAHPLAAGLLSSLQELARTARGRTPFETLCAALEALRYRALLRLQHGDRADRALANLDTVLEVARLYSVQGIQTFARDMMRAWKEADREVEGAPDFETDAVHLLTIHGAKGLEWPVVMVINTMGRAQRASGLLHRREDDTVHACVVGQKPDAYRDLRTAEDAELSHERTRLWYVACTRARDLLVLPRHAQPPAASWLSEAPFELTHLPPFELPGGPRPGLEKLASPRGNEQTPQVFSVEAERIAEGATPVHWIQPSRHEQGEPEERPREPASEDFVQAPTDIQGSAARGTVLHKLMEEILTGELGEDDLGLAARATTLLEQLGIPPANEPSAGPCPTEMAATVTRTLALPEIRDLRPQLVPELSVLGTPDGADGAAAAIAGFADAIALDDDGQANVVFDWKSDIAPDERTRGLYRNQIAQYVRAVGAHRGAVVYMTPGQIDWLESPAP
jgi:ATP-dependent exoDNAse (exonuclease V) beta subunit